MPFKIRVKWPLSGLCFSSFEGYFNLISEGKTSNKSNLKRLYPLKSARMFRIFYGILRKLGMTGFVRFGCMPLDPVP